MENLLKQFSLFAEELQLPEFISEKVKVLLSEINNAILHNSPEISHKVLFACCIYIVIQDNDSTEMKIDEDIISSLTVSKLLERAGMSIMDFFAVTCFLKTHHHLSNSSKQNLIALERKYLIVSALYDKFESMIGEIFCAEYNSAGQNNSDSNCKLNELLQHHKAQCWMLFIVSKAKVLWHRQELLATFNLLLCCVAEVIKATPTFLLLPPFDTIVTKNEDSSAVLKVLSNQVKTKFDEVTAVHEGFLHVANELIVESKLPELQNLQHIYNQLYLQSGDIDESQFLCHDWHLLPHNSEQSASPRKQHLTLIRRTLDTADALNKILLTTSDELPESLKTCLQKCTIDGTEIIKKFINKSEKTFVNAFVNAHEGGDRNLAVRRFKLAVRYYYIMLDTFLKKESERLAPPEFTSFIQNEVLHKSLLSCCLEVIIMSSGNIRSVNFTPLDYGGNIQAQGIAFPWILNVFELESFQFFKVIESFIRAAPTITQRIVKHLKEIEDKILEYLAWQSGSSIFRGLSGYGCSPTCKAKLDTPKSMSVHWSPNKDPSQSSPNTPNLCHAVNLFLNKVSRLAFQRLEKLCSLLQISKDVQASVWTCIEHVIYKKTHLLKDRHLDQIIMCCIFAICKVLEKEVRFKSIVSCYSQLHNTSVSVYKYVLSAGKKDYIIAFYNNEFHQEMKEYILATFGNKNKIDSPLSLSSISSPLTLSPSFSLPGRKNIFISPLRQSPFKNPNEVISQLFPTYSVGSLTQSSKTLQTINDTLNVLHPTWKKPEDVKSKKRLQFTDGDSESTGDCSRAKRFLKFDPVESSSENSKSKELNISNPDQ